MKASRPPQQHDQHHVLTRRWKPALLAAFVLALITSIPQIHLTYVRGSEWNGSCALSDPDELPYLAYTNALIEGRPRRNDPYGGRDNSRFETLFSLQFLPPYTVAIPAKLFGISTDTAFIFLLPLATFGTVIVAWWLLYEVTGQSPLAIIGAISIVSIGTVAAHSPFHILQGVETGYDPFPLLRRYIPALPFPVFLAASCFIWRALTKDLRWAFLAGLSFSALVYSYFFLWTALAAWFFTILLLWFVARPQDRTRTLKVCGILLFMSIAALGPYTWLLMQRVESLDRGQLLELRHTPDILRAPEFYGAMLIFALVHFVRRTKAHHDPRVLFAASFALAPFIVFNQQVITGRSLQPFHYEEFVANYWVVLAGMLSLGVLRQDLPKRILVYLGLAAIGIAVLLAERSTRIMAETNVRLDQVRPASLSLNEKNITGLVFASDRFLTHSIPSITNKPVLWARYTYTFSDGDWMEQKKRYYQYLYYSGVDEQYLTQLLRNDFTTRWEIFGAERANPLLSASHKHISEDDIQNAATEYASFIRLFDSTLAKEPLLSYAIVSPDDSLVRLDRWYERDSGESLGQFVIYRLKIKATE